MLDAAVAGEVFTSPTPDQITAATTAVSGGAGVLHIVKNYTGDVLNFQLAAELADDDGIKVATVLVDDDVAVQDSLYTAGRRGTGGTVVVEKVAGALAATGADLAAVAALATEANQRQPQLRHRADRVHHRPHAGTPSFDLGPRRDRDRHRHPRRAGPRAAARSGRPRSWPRSRSRRSSTTTRCRGDDALVFVNGMGGTPQIELYIVYGRGREDPRGAAASTVARSLVGNYVTSLEMAGCMLTLTKLDDELTRLWDAPVNTPGLRWGV